MPKVRALAIAALGALWPLSASAVLPVATVSPPDPRAPSRSFWIESAPPLAPPDGDAAEHDARDFLAKHLTAFAEGTSESDFLLVSDDLDGSLRTIGFRQMHDGIPVRGAEIAFVYAKGRLVLVLSRAVPFDSSNDPGPPPDASLGDVVLLPMPRHAFRWAKHRRAVSPPILGALPSERDELVDAVSGALVFSDERLRFSTGEIAFHVPVRSPSFGPRVDIPAPAVNLTVDGTSVVSSALGAFPFIGTSAHVEAWATGTHVEILSPGMPGASATFDIGDGATHSWDASSDELVDAQLSAFIHASEVNAYAKTFAPNLSFLDDPVEATVNADGVCNSYSDGTFIHFFKSGNGCENTARIADIVYHEYGHSIHSHAIIPGAGVFDGALSEGVADYLAATMTGDPGVGRGMHFDSTPVRDLDPPDYENRWPDDLVGEIHHDGLIIGQTLWDLRKALIAKLGPDAGRARADFLFYEGIRRAADIPSMYSTVLVADDDDANISNGTPNICEINRAFGLHGLRGISVPHTIPGLEPETEAGYPLEAHVLGLFPGCADDTIASATVTFRTEGSDSPPETIPLAIDGTTLRGTLPRAPARTTLDYQIQIALEGGTTLLLPDNAADPWYQLRTGPVLPIRCTDFEKDPSAEGWTHGASTPNADDWEAGLPYATPFNADPSAPFSGLSVFGNDLGDFAGHDGKYQANMTNWAESPVIDTTGYDEVRLQYRRWLTVEDASADQASIYANGQLAWRNRDSGLGASPPTDHRDREWRFHDVDLTPFVRDHSVKLRFELASHGERQLGGWTLDSLCVVGVPHAASPPTAGIAPRGGPGCSASDRDPDGAQWALLGFVLSCAVYCFRASRGSCPSP